MNRGNIPGYYFDAEKKKYFKIQANHVAPSDAKYSKSKVDEEKRETKKRKVEAAQRSARMKQTVSIARSLQHPLLAGCGLLREQGTRNHQRNAVQRDATLIDHLESGVACIDIPHVRKTGARLTDAQYLRETKQMVLASNISPGAHGLYVYDCDDAQLGHTPFAGRDNLHCFRDNIVGLSTAVISNESYVVACSLTLNSTEGNVFVSKVTATAEERWYSGGQLLRIGPPDTTLWACKINPTTSQFALTGTEAVSVFPLHRPSHPEAKFKFPTRGDCLAVEWLDAHTLAFETSRPRRRGPGTAHTVRLWDLRSDGDSCRIRRGHRITGLEKADDSGHNLLVTSSRNINLYDLRILREDRPLLSFDHRSDESQLGFSTYRGIVAAMDERNQVQTYSLREGRKLAMLGLSRWAQGSMKKPRWYEDGQGSPFLQVCCDSRLQVWSWQGPWMEFSQAEQ